MMKSRWTDGQTLGVLKSLDQKILGLKISPAGLSTSNQGWAKPWVFHQKPSSVGLTGLNRVLMGYMG